MEVTGENNQSSEREDVWHLVLSPAYAPICPCTSVTNASSYCRRTNANASRSICFGVPLHRPITKFVNLGAASYTMEIDRAVKAEDDSHDKRMVDSKPSYRSWKKKYRKMRVIFEGKMREGENLYKLEQKALETANRLAVENE
jgi:hypothetical protein